MNEEKRSICVVGLGYIGLPTASLLGTKGYKVTGVDVSPEVVETINNGRIHIVEPDLDILVKSAVGSGNLKASLKPVEADVFIVAVPTPLRDVENSAGRTEKVPDLNYVEAATRSIAPFVKSGNLVILESTSPIGTTNDLVAKVLEEHGVDVESKVHVAHCPERVLPGRILIELIENDRVVGGVTESSTQAAVAFYREFVSGEVIATNARTAELVKLMENSYRDVNIAFANEISMLCDAEKINSWEAIKLANRHPRVNVLNPGPGVGGHCIAVDPWFLVNSQPDHTCLIRTAREVNDSKTEWVLDKVRKSARKFREPAIACLGVAFKADVDDLRESPALIVVEKIIEERLGQVVVCEPNIRSHEDFENVSLARALDASDILVILVDHKEFKHLAKDTRLAEKVVIDSRGIVVG